MRSLRTHAPARLKGRAATMTSLVGASLAAACLAGTVHAQTTTDPVIVLPTVDVETTVEPKPAAKLAQTARSQPRSATAPQVCMPELAGTPVCAAQEAAEAAAAAAERQARAGTNPNADAAAPFKADRLTNSKLQARILDVPRTVTAVTKETLDTTGTTSVRQLARSTPGISLGFGEGGNAFGDNIYIRGFKANSDIYVDGVRDPGISVRENFATEQVEVLKGPSGSVAGRGTTGGALNIATKKPQDVDFLRTTTEMSDAGTMRQTFDYNLGENRRLQLRLNGMIQDGEVAGRDGVYDDRKGLAAALRYKLSDTVTIEVEAQHTEMNQMPDWGVPYITDGDTGDSVDLPNGPVTDHGVDRDTFYGVSGRDFQEVTQDVLTGRVIWDIAPDMKLTNTLRASRSVNDYILTAPSSVSDNGSADPADWTVGLSFKSLYQETETLSNDLELTGKGDWFGARHTYVLGLHLAQESVGATGYDNLTSEDYNPPVGQRGCAVSAIDPDPSGCWAGATPVRGTQFTETDVNTVSLYAMDRIELSPQWVLDAGIRLDHYDITRSGVDRDGTPYTLSRTDTMWNGNLGLTWKPRDNLSVYGAVGTSSNPMGQEIAAGGGIYGGLDSGGENLAPEQNTAFEVGVKYELQDHLLLTAALFQTTKDNAREDIGPRGSAVTYDTLKYRLRGVELGIAGRVGDRIGLFGGAVAMDSEILDSQDTAAIGQELATITHKQFNLLATYDVTDALMLGLQANYAGERELGTLTPNGNMLPSYWTLDLVGSYDLTKTAALRFGIKNMGDVTYYDTAYRSGEPFTYVAPGREIWAALDLRF